MRTNLRIKTCCSLDTILHQFTAAKGNDSLGDMPEPRKPSWPPTVLFYMTVQQKHLCKLRLHPANDHSSSLHWSEMESLNTGSSSAQSLGMSMLFLWATGVQTYSAFLTKPFFETSTSDWGGPLVP